MNFKNLDLDINNYCLDELFSLFHIQNNDLTEESMKKAKTIVHKVHPDKSQLDSKYFIFFSKAYKKLYEVYEFQNKSSNKKIENYASIDNDQNNTLLEKFIKTNDLDNSQSFNKWFNKEFEKNNYHKQDEGYQEWFKSDEDLLGNNNSSKSDMTDVISQFKHNAITTYKGDVNGIDCYSMGMTNLGDQSSFSSPMFSDSLKYNDLKDAYQNTIIGVNEELEKPSYTINQYKNMRDTQNLNPKTEEEANQYFHQKSREENEESIQTAYKLTKEFEENKIKNEKFWRKMQQITNS